MPRLSIDLTQEQHKELKTIAALMGISIKDYVLSKTLISSTKRTLKSKDPNLEDLADILRPRIKEAEKGYFSELSFSEIIKSAKDSIA